MAGKQSPQSLLEEALQKIQVPDNELNEARDRRERIKRCVRSEFSSDDAYDAGSIAHGDAIQPLSDVDMGVVVEVDGYGPDEQGPRDLMDRARVAIRDELADDFPHLRVVVEGQNHAVKVFFGAPVGWSPSDFTADVVIALPHSGPGIWIPTLKDDAWELSAPREHTALMREGNRSSQNDLARTVRLLKHHVSHNADFMYSWNVKVLAQRAVTRPMPLLNAMDAFFEEALSDLQDGETKDPINISPPIELPLPIDEVRSRLRGSRTHVLEAISAAEDGRLLTAQDHLAELFPGIVERPSQNAVMEEEAERLRSSDRAGRRTATVTGVAVAVPATRAWRSPR